MQNAEPVTVKRWQNQIEFGTPNVKASPSLYSCTKWMKIFVALHFITIGSLSQWPLET